MQIPFDSLVNPPYITEGIAMLVAVILIILLYASIQLRSMLGMFGFMLMIIAFIATFTVGISLLWFWLTVCIEVIILSLAATVFVRASARGKN